jgi:energy-coupling factor transporter ATP-binding protein EcfA2
VIEARELTERYGDTTAVHSLSCTIAPGTVTGFPGPNGAGRSTTMRVIMGLDRPTSGTVTVTSKPYRQHRAQLREVGALLEASAVHPGRGARSHLRSMAATHDIKASRPRRLLGLGGHASLPFPVQASRASLTRPLPPDDGSVEDPYDACHVDSRTATSTRRSSRLLLGELTRSLARDRLDALRAASRGRVAN